MTTQQAIGCDTCGKCKRRPAAGTMQSQSSVQQQIGCRMCGVCAQDAAVPALRENDLDESKRFVDAVITSEKRRAYTTAQARQALHAMLTRSGSVAKYDQFARHLVEYANHATTSAIKTTVCTETRLVAHEQLAAALFDLAERLQYDGKAPDARSFVLQSLCRLAHYFGGCMYRARAMFKTLVRPFSGSKSGAHLPYAPVNTPAGWSAIDVTTVNQDIGDDLGLAAADFAASPIGEELAQDIGARFRRPHFRVPGKTTGRASYDTGAMAKIVTRHLAKDPAFVRSRDYRQIDAASFGARIRDAAVVRDGSSTSQVAGMGPMRAAAATFGPFLDMARKQTETPARRERARSPARNTDAVQQFLAENRDPPSYETFVDHMWRIYRTWVGVDMRVKARADPATGKALADIAKIVHAVAEDLTLVTGSAREPATELARKVLDGAFAALQAEFASASPAPPPREPAQPQTQAQTPAPANPFGAADPFGGDELWSGPK
jgi:hypothetical protein